MRALISAAVLALVGCGDVHLPFKDQSAPTRPAVAEAAAVEATVQLPGNDGRVHIVRVPTGYLESARCIVTVNERGEHQSSCAAPTVSLPDR